MDSVVKAGGRRLLLLASQGGTLLALSTLRLLGSLYVFYLLVALAVVGALIYQGHLGGQQSFSM